MVRHKFPIRKQWLISLGNPGCGKTILAASTVDKFKILEGSTIKLLLFSRPDVKHLSKITAKIQRLAIDRSSSQDIRTFCSKKLEDLIEEDVLPSDTNTSGLTSHLVTGADGMFLWTTLMFKYLESDSFTPTQRVHK